MGITCVKQTEWEDALISRSSDRKSLMGLCFDHGGKFVRSIHIGY